MTNSEKIKEIFPNGIHPSSGTWMSMEYKEPTLKNDLGVYCISRDSAIKALDYDIKCFEFKPGVSHHMNDIAKLLNTIYETQVKNIKVLPSVTPQSRKGHWVLTDVEEDRIWHCNCSECDKDPQDYIGGSEDWWLIKNKLPKFCPNCGAKMVDSQESEYSE